MAKVTLISCVRKKIDYKTKAEDMYISPLFKMNLKFAKKMQSDKIFILSAKHGLLSLEKKIEPYNQTLNTMKESKKKEWAEKVIIKLKSLTDLQNDEFVFLAGENYRKYIIPLIKKYQIPMRGLGIGKQLQYLKRRINE
jgi:hypothetical protein